MKPKTKPGQSTESYTDTLWRYSKNIAKGALWLGGGFLLYTAWRNSGAQSSITNNTNANLSTNITPFTPLTNDTLQIPIVDFSNNNNYSDFTDSTLHFKSHKKRRTSSITQCIPYWQEFPSQTQIAGAAFSNDNYVITWTGTDGYVYAQIYAADGNLFENQISVSSSQTDPSYPPAVAVLSNDEFVITWPLPNIFQPGSGYYDIYAQRYDQLGNQLETEFQVNYLGGVSIDFPTIAALSNGTFVIVYTQDYIGCTVTAKYYSSTVETFIPFFSDGSGVTTRFYPIVTRLNESFAIIAVSESENYNEAITAGMLIFLPTFISRGSPIIDYGADTAFKLAKTQMATAIAYPIIAGLNDGQLVAAWIVDENVYATYAQPENQGDYVFAQPWNTSQVNTISGKKNRPGITTLVSDIFIIAWQNQNGNIYIRRFLPTPSSLGTLTPIGPEILLFSSPATYSNANIYTQLFSFTNGDFFLLTQNWAQRIYQSLALANTCSQSYTENIPQNLGLSVSPLSYTFNQTNITVQLHNMTAGQLNSLKNISGTASAHYNTTTGIWFETGANVLDLNALLNTLQFIPAKDYYGSAMISVDAQDNLGNVFQSDFTLTGISVNYPPSWVNNQLIINQGQTLTLSRNNLQVYDLGKSDSVIQINVISALNGQFEWLAQPGNAIILFTQQDVDNALVTFAHNGLAFSPTYALTATDNVYTTQVSTGNVNFDLTPEIFVNVLTINSKGQTVTLTSSQILAVDNNDLPNQLIFTATNIQNGHFEISTNPGKATTTFSQLFIDSGLVKFIHDGSDQSPGYTLSVNDGRITSQPSDAVVAFNVPTSIPLTETTGFKAGISVLSIAASTMIGFATWRYRNHKDAERRREKYPIAKEVREQMHISGVANFEAGDGVQFIYLIDKILDELIHKGMDFKIFTEAEQSKLALAIAHALQAYTTKIIPAKKLTGTNTITHYYNNVYYLKIKPLRKSDLTWLKIDEAKKVTDQIAIKAKDEWDNPTVKSAVANNDIEMQRLRK